MGEPTTQAGVEPEPEAGEAVKEAGTPPEPEGGRAVGDTAAPEASQAGPAPKRSRLRDSMGGNVLVIAVVTLLVLAGVWVVNGLLREDPTPQASASAGTGGVSEVTLTGETTGKAPVVGEAAPDFTTLSTAGQEVTLSELRGKPVWLVFGATWCANCRSEAPDVQAVHEALGERAAVVTIFVGENLSTVSDYAERIGLTTTVVADPYTTVGSLYRVMGLPTHVFVAPDGAVDSIQVGTLTAQAATEKLEALAGR